VTLKRKRKAVLSSRTGGEMARGNILSEKERSVEEIRRVSTSWRRLKSNQERRTKSGKGYGGREGVNRKKAPTSKKKL